jgi:hypothetical protein
MATERASGLWFLIGGIPRYVIYLLLAGVVAWQLLYPIRLPMRTSSTTEGVYEAIRRVPDDKIVILCTDWDASTQPETGPQTEAIMRACFQEGKRFAVLNIAAPMGYKLAHEIAKEAAEDYPVEYGEDWCNFGFKVGFRNVLLTLAQDVPEAVKTDFEGTAITDLPMMRGIDDVRQVGLVVEISGLAGVIEPWISLIQGPHQVPFASAVTAVMAPGYYPYLDSGQMEGMLVGARGAAEMESIIARPGMGNAIMSAQSMAHIFIVLLIVLGNASYLRARSREQGSAR